MEFFEKLTSLAAEVRPQGAAIQTEEATKNAFVMPFINTVLGYDVFDPHEVTPEFVCDVGTKKGEKIDYEIMKDGEVQIRIECKKNRRIAQSQSCLSAVSLFSCHQCPDFYPDQRPGLQIFH